MLALPIFPARLQASIFGRSELNFRVRNGNGWTLALISTNLLCCLLFFEKKSKQKKLLWFSSPYRSFQRQVFYQIFASLSRTFPALSFQSIKVLFAFFFLQEKEGGDPYGNRTHVCGVRGRRLNRLTNGPCHASRPSLRHTARHCAKNTFALRANCFFSAWLAVRLLPDAQRFVLVRLHGFEPGTH